MPIPTYTVKISPPAPTAEERREAMLTFCERAHERTVEVAKQCNIPRETLAELDLASMRQRTDDERVALLARVSKELKENEPDHTGEFPDFIEFANRISQQITEGTPSQGAPCLRAPSPQSPALDAPTMVALDVIRIKDTNYHKSKNPEEKANCVLLLTLLRDQTERVIPVVSSAAERTLGSLLVPESEEL
jgi:hypothetical protein